MNEWMQELFNNNISTLEETLDMHSPYIVCNPTWLL